MELISSLRMTKMVTGNRFCSNPSSSQAAAHLCSTWWFLVRPSVPAGRTGSAGSSLLPPPQSRTRSESKNKSPLRSCRHLGGREERESTGNKSRPTAAIGGFYSIILFIYLGVVESTNMQSRCGDICLFFNQPQQILIIQFGSLLTCKFFWLTKVHISLPHFIQKKNVCASRYATELVLLQVAI